jgi:hypothetical protein
MARRRRAQEEGGEQDVYLLDLAASIFAIMLIYLLIAAHQITSIEQKDEVANYSPRESKTIAFPLATWRPLNIYKESWVVQNGTISRIDYKSIASHYMQNGSAPLYHSPSKNDPSFFLGNVTLTSLDGLPTEFGIDYQAGKDAVIGRDAVHDRSYPISGEDGLIKSPNGSLPPDAAAKFTEPLAIYVFGDVGSQEFHFFQELQKAKPSSQFIFSKEHTLSVTRAQPNFALNIVYR